MSLELITRIAVTVRSTEYRTGLPKPDASSNQLQVFMTIIIATLAALSVLMIALAGFRFIAGQGSPEEVAKARSTMIYAVAGLLVAISAQVIVTFVLDKL